MSIISAVLKSRKDRLNELEAMITASERRKRGTSDPGYRAELEISINQYETEYQAVETEIAVLEKQQLPEKTAEELQKRIIETWDDNCHRIDYQHTLNKIRPILEQIGNIQGGTAIFLIPEGNKMYGKWLLKRVREWTEVHQHSQWIIRPLSISAIDNISVLSELSAAFGVQAHETLADYIRAVADAIFDSVCDDNVVIALAITIRLPKVSSDLFCGFIQWFLGNVWKKIVESHPIIAQNKTFIRLVIFILTDLKLQELSTDIIVEAPNNASDKCTIVRILPWQEDDVVTWVHKFSGLKDVGYPNQILTDYGREAHTVGDGVPLPTWARLREIMHEELTSKIEEIKHGKLASVPI